MLRAADQGLTYRQKLTLYKQKLSFLPVTSFGSGPKQTLNLTNKHKNPAIPQTPYKLKGNWQSQTKLYLQRRLYQQRLTEIIMISVNNTKDTYTTGHLQELSSLLGDDRLLCRLTGAAAGRRVRRRWSSRRRRRRLLTWPSKPWGRGAVRTPPPVVFCPLLKKS